MGLRAYQMKARHDIHKGFEEFDRQLGVLPTGGGKTILFSRLAQDFQPKRTLILAHREELISQAVDKLRTSTGIEAHVEMGEDRAALDAPVVVASIQTLMREPRRNRWPRDHFGLVVVDECFPAGTQVDGRPIETISEGDVVNAYNHGGNEVVPRKVTRVFRRETNSICQIHLSDGRSLVCTPCHPFWDGSAYVPAEKLTPQSVVYGITGKQISTMQALWSHGGVSGKETKSPQSQCGTDGRGLLQPGMQGRTSSGDEFKDNGPDKPAVCITANASEQPDARPGRQSQNDDDVEGNAVDATGSRRQRKAAPSCAIAASVGAGLGNGS